MKKNALNLMKKVVLWTTPLAFFCCYPSYATNTTVTQNQKAIQETAKILQNLTQYEIDESFLIDQCISNVSNEAIKAKLFTIKGECDERIKELAMLVKKYGGAVPTYSKDFKGYFMNGYAAMRGGFTDQGALKALDTNIKLILKAFESTLKPPLPQDVKDTITKICEDKKKTLQYLDIEIRS